MFSLFMSYAEIREAAMGLQVAWYKLAVVLLLVSGKVAYQYVRLPRRVEIITVIRSCMMQTIQTYSHFCLCSSCYSINIFLCQCEVSFVCDHVRTAKHEFNVAL